MIGLRLVASMPDAFAGVIVSNTGISDGSRGVGEGFKKWCDYSQRVPVFDIPFIVSSAVLKKLTEEELAAYDAPFPDDSYKVTMHITHHT